MSMSRSNRLRGAALALAASVLAACATAPETGRSQLLLVDAGQEAQMGFSAFERKKQQTPRAADRAANQQLQTAIAFWRRLQANNAGRGGKGPEFLSTHPLDETRIAELQKFLPQAMAEYQRAGGRG